MKPRERMITTCQCGRTYDRGQENEGYCSDCLTIHYSQYWSHPLSQDPANSLQCVIKGLIYGLLLLVLVPTLEASEIDAERLCGAIYKAEGGAKTRHPYGIMQKYKTTTPRQACLNTVASAKKRYDTSDEFISYLAYTYCPLDAENWAKNVKWFYDKK